MSLKGGYPDSCCNICYCLCTRLVRAINKVITSVEFMHDGRYTCWEYAVSSKRLHCELALKQKVLVYIERQKQSKTKQNNSVQWSINLLVVKQIFLIGRMTAIQYFIAKHHQVLCEIEEKRYPWVDGTVMLINESMESISYYSNAPEDRKIYQIPQSRRKKLRCSKRLALLSKTSCDLICTSHRANIK